MIKLDPNRTALVLIDLQKGIMGYPLAPYTATEVISAATALAARFRQAGAPVVLVNVVPFPDAKGAPVRLVDSPSPRPPGGYPPGFSDLVDGLAEDSDIRITKRSWGAFHGTDLDLQLRRLGITTIVLAGVATNMGVESTARSAWEHGYELVIPEDASTTMSAEMHTFSIGKILPRISRVAKAAEIELQKIEATDAPAT